MNPIGFDRFYSFQSSFHFSFVIYFRKRMAKSCRMYDEHGLQHVYTNNYCHIITESKQSYQLHATHGMKKSRTLLFTLGTRRLSIKKSSNCYTTTPITIKSQAGLGKMVLGGQYYCIAIYLLGTFRKGWQ
jgi:hypothetical protein